MAYPNDPPAPSGMTLTSESINTGLVGFWPLTDGSGTTATDLSTGGNDGTLSGNEVGWSTESKGTVSYVGFSADRMTSSTTVSSQPITISMWCAHRASAGGFNHFFDGVGTDRVRAYNTSTIQMGTATSTAATSVTFTRDGSWQHFAFVFDSGNGVLYKDGVLADTVTGIGSGTLASGFILGDQQSGGGYSLNSYMQNVRIWDRALTATEVATLYSTPWAGTSYTDVTYAGYYLLDEPFKRL